MNDTWPLAKKYINLLKPCTRIDSKFMQALREQQLELDSLFKTNLCMRCGEVAEENLGKTHLNRKEAKEMYT